MTNLTGGTRGDKPVRVALVLGSGGVRSAAALGIADVLKRAGLRPDLIVGCSSGALFGAAIATGMATDEALALAIELWSQDLTERRRWRAYAEMIAPRLMGFDAGFSLRDARMIARRIEQGFGGHRLERLPIPLRVVTTEASSGDSHVLTHGPLADALRASIAVPFIFPSVEFDGRRLVDGVLSDPLPVAVARDAEVVVALGFKGVLPRRIDRPSRLFGQVSTAMINNLQAAQVRAAVAAGQRIVQVELDIDRRVGLWQSSAIPRIFDAGKQAAERHLDQIFSLLSGGGARAA